MKLIPTYLGKPYALLCKLVISESSSTQPYKILTGTSVVIGFQYKGSLVVVDTDTPQPLSGTGITGLHDRFKMFRNASPTGTVLVYFSEGATAMFFKTLLHELFRESVSLDNFLLRSDLLVTEVSPHFITEFKSFSGSAITATPKQKHPLHNAHPNQNVYYMRYDG